MDFDCDLRCEVKSLYAQGYDISEIAKKLDVTPEVVKDYLKEEDSDVFGYFIIALFYIAALSAITLFIATSLM